MVQSNSEVHSDQNETWMAADPQKFLVIGLASYQVGPVIWNVEKS